MNDITAGRIRELRREIAHAEDRKRFHEPGSELYTGENRIIAAAMQTIARLQSDVQS